MPSDNTDYDHLFKILILGDSGVGKTTILQRFAHDFFSNEYVATIGVDFQIRSLEIDRKRCKLQVWDTAGQDRFKSIVATFYRNANGVLLCFDITDLKSFHSVNNWFEDVKRYCPENTPVYLIGTKSDLTTQRMVTDDMIKSYAEKNNLLYLETSSKVNENVEKCFINITRMLLERTNSTGIIQTPDKINLDHRKPKPVKSGCFENNKCTI